MTNKVKWFLSYRFVTTVAMQAKMTILGYFLYKISGLALALGMLGLYEALPKIILALPAGYQVERMEKRKALLIIGFSYLLLAVLLYLAMIIFKQSNTYLTYSIYFCVFCMGVIGSLRAGASIALFSSLIPKGEMAQYSAMSSNSWQIGSVVGPILGGYLIKFVGSQDAFIFVIALLVFGIVAIFQLPKYESHLRGKFSLQDSFEKMREGLKFVYFNKVMLWAISLDLFAVLFGGCVALLPIFAKDILCVGSEGFGHLRAAMPLGAALSLTILAKRPIQNNTGKWLIIFVALFGLAIIGFALSKSFYLSLFLLFAMGAFDAVSVVIRGALLLIETPDDMRARVTSVNSMFISSSNEIGAFESGFAAQYLGVIRSVVFGGTMTLLFATLAWTKAKDLMNYEFKNK